MKSITKTILNLIITTFGVLFILSACGGGGVTVGLVNQTCSSNLFSPDCGASGQAARTKAITDCVESGECDAVPKDVQTCLTDLFSPDCDAVAETIKTRTTETIETLQMTFCETNGANDNCQTTPTVMQTCMNDPFDSVCGATYNTNREASCRTTPNPTACGATITRFCETEAVATLANLFDPLCATYNTARETACRDTPAGLDCASTITQYCEMDATPANGNTLNSLCADGKYNAPREIACRTGSHAPLCSATITRFCETDATPANGNTLNPLCVDVKYNTPREVACRTGNHANLCPATITRFCQTNPTVDTYFDPLCVADTTAIMKRDEHCGMGAENGATATAFTDMRCADNTKGLEVRDAHCVIGDTDLTGNAFKEECVLNPAAQAILLTASECTGAMEACLPSLRIICEAEVASFSGLCQNARDTRCVDALRLFDESICHVDAYDADRETACLMDTTNTVRDGCARITYKKLCSVETGNPFDTGAGATGRIDCQNLPHSSERNGFALVRQMVCGNSRPIVGSKFETECNSLIVNLCTANPYDIDAGAADYNCYTDEAFNPQRGTHRETCRVGAAAADPNCAELLARDACIGDPFYSTCDAVEYREERNLREVYCLSGVVGGIAFGEGIPLASSSITNVDRLCGTFRIPICSWDGVSEVSDRLNPAAAICPSGAAGTLIQIVYCTIGNNWNDPAIRPGCNTANDTFGGCIENPFKTTSITDSRSVCTTSPAQFGLAALANRVKFCSGDVDIDDPAQLALCVVAGQDDAEDSLCASSGTHANPFSNLCVREGTDFDAVRAGFLASCKTSETFAPACPSVLVCDTDPYSTDCVDKSVYSPSRQTIVNECEGLGAETTDSRCTTAIKDCIATPYGDNCKDNPDYTMVRANFLNNCGDSNVARGGGDETKCRPAFDTFCVGDNLFTDTGANCLGDVVYKPARDTHFAECKKAANARAAGTDCTIAFDQICQGGESFYTDPFVSLCKEGGRVSLMARQAVIERCQPLSENAWEADGNESCNTNGANTILSNCGDDPFSAECADYSVAYTDARTMRVMQCGTAFEDRCNGTQARLCVSSDNAEAAPLAPACDNVEGIATIRSDFLAACDGGDGGVRNCSAAIAMAVKTACELDPYNTMVSTINAETVDCNDFDFYNGARGMRLTDCASSASNVCDGVIGIVCSATGDSSGAGANPFHANLCDEIDADVLAIAQRDFCQIRANIGKDDCTNGDLSRPTTASVLELLDIGTADDVPSIPTADAPSAEVHNEFLKGTDTGLNTNGYLQKDGAAAEVIVINMADAEYDNMPLGGDSADGIAFFVGRPAGGTARVEYYAGILAGADLDAVLRREVGATVEWYGAVNWAILDGDSKGFLYQSGTSTDRATRDFVLTIDLDARMFRSFFGRGGAFTAGQQGFHLAGGYDATTGVITNGEVLFGVSTVSGSDVKGIVRGVSGSGGYHFKGPLIGIIGREGALGVFHAQRDDKAQGESLSGGFVARAPYPDFINWTRYAANLAGESLTILTTAVGNTAATSFIRGGTGALDVGTGGVDYTLTLADNYSLEGVDHRIVSFGGQAADGVSFALNGDSLYSGLLSGTDLGAPLIVGSSSVNFQGRLGIIINDGTDSTYYIRHDLQLTAESDGRVNGSTGSVGKTGVDAIFTLTGRFNQFGLISGTVAMQRNLIKMNHGTLSGLIGADGVIGSFISNDQTTGAFAYAGGFVARADGIISANTENARARTAANWVANAVDANGTALIVLEDSTEIGGGEPFANFYTGGADGLDLALYQPIQTAKLDFSESFTDSLGDTFRLGGGTTDGVAFTSTMAALSTKFYVGLLSTTALGQPVSHTAPSAQWAGRFGLIKKAGLNSNTPYTASFILNVNFRDRRIYTSSISIPASVLANDEVADEFEFSGNYDGHGLIRGTVSYKKIVTGGGETNFVGHLSGLIGVDGAVGAFASTTNRGDDAYVGGFVARDFAGLVEVSKGPVTPLRLKDYATLPTLPNQLTTSGFLKPVSGVATLNVTPANFLTQHAIDANHTGRRGGVNSTDDDGYHYFNTAHDTDDTSYSYGGILSTTNLGAPVADSGVAAVWTGYFSHYSDITDQDAEFYVDFTAGTVGFANATNDGVAAKTFDGDNFTVNGRFGASHNLTTGQLGGTVTRINAGPDDTYNIFGLIGEEGAVAVFIDFDRHTAGGFTASNPKHEDYCTANGRFCIADYAAWLKSFATPLTATLNTGTPRNQFLKSTFDRLNQTGVTGPQPFGISVANSNATFDSIALELDMNDGMAFFEGDINGTGYFYAGILSNTDLGAPVGLTFEGETKGRWNGRFGYRTPVTYYEDFRLEIDFANRRIEAFVAGRPGNYFHLKGGYDTSGAITDGTVDYGAFTANTRTQTASRTPNGVLTGLIGEQGAIGAFISNEAGNSGYAGGFVVTPTAGFDPSVVKYNDWADIFDTPLPNQLDASARHNQFLGTVAGATLLDGTGINRTMPERQPKALTLADFFDTITLVGDATDGVSFFWDNWGVAGYSGILAGTDLGAPVAQGNGPAQVEWKGIFQAFVGSFASVLDIKRDFVLEIDFTNNANKIEAFVQQTGEYHYHLTGSFDENGVITGEVDFGEFTDATRDQKTTRADNNGFLTGLIGEQGAVGAFLSGTGTRDSITTADPILYSGGFVASPNVVNHLSYTDWAGSFDNLQNQLNATTRVSQFLGTASAATALDETGVGTSNAANKGSLTLANATFKGAALGGQAADGVSWFWDSDNDFGYAGILAGTDLGVPLTQTNGTAKWNGRFRATGNVSRDFILEIDFANSNKIAAFVYHSDANYYHLTGDFDATNGVITGKVNYGTFSDLTARTPTASRADNGILTGLIGSQGAVGAFISGTGDKNAITASDPVVNYAGGFVAKPTAPLDDNVVNYDDWARSFASLPPPQAYQTGNRRPQFLGTDVWATEVSRAGALKSFSFSFSRLDLDDSFSEISFAGHAADGVSFFWDSWGSAGYAGILAGTDFGAPLRQSGDDAQVTWNGQFYVLSVSYATSSDVTTHISREFVLEIDFADSNKIEAFVQRAGNIYHHLKGSFDANGVITGTVNYGAFNAGTRVATGTPARPDNGILTGLIGAEGAVGAFVSGTGDKDAIVRNSALYSGGFIANSTAVSTGVNVKFNDWTRSFASAPATAPSTTFQNQFLSGTADNITATAVGLWAEDDETGVIAPTLLTLKTDLGVSADTKNGVGFFRGYDSAGERYYYAGIFNGADLGAPLTSDTAAGVWKGKFQVISASAPVDTDFTLEVTFGEVSGFSEFAGTVDAFVFATDTYYYHLTGTYDRNGVITGVVDFGPFTDADKTMPGLVAEERVDGTLTGLIGQKGAIGVFVNDATTFDGYAGGFVACKRNTDDTACQ